MKTVLFSGLFQREIFIVYISDGSSLFRTTPKKADTASPDTETVFQIVILSIAIPKTRISEDKIRFLECPKSRLASMSVRTPMEAIIPKRMTETPPITGCGTVCSTAPNFPMILKNME